MNFAIRWWLVVAVASSGGLAVAQSLPDKSSGDPYAADFANAAKARSAQENANFARERNSHLDVVRLLYFAIGCKVFQTSLQQAGSGMLLRRELKNIDDAHMRAFNAESPAALDAGTAERHRGKLLADQKLTEDAERDGLARAKQAAVCDFWHQHPEAVYEIRHAVEAEFQQ